MKKLISLLSILFMLILSVPTTQVEAFRGPERPRGSGVPGGNIRPGGPGGIIRPGEPGGVIRQDRYIGHGRYRSDRSDWWFLPGLIIGGFLGWGFGPRYYYPPDYYYSIPPEGNQEPQSPGRGSENRVFIYPRQGQSAEEQTLDFDECHGWAVNQTGYDPKRPLDGPPDAWTIQKSADYFRAISACLDARGYTVR